MLLQTFLGEKRATYVVRQDIKQVGEETENIILSS